ncbi:hypothetical protein OF83DRAFT_1167438 [Amylostereum chailletii]|nr:hypothetical protein OF83DRAFT_1167438 [Amylostereum chailletii]
MDIDEPFEPSASHSPNAVAGPSTLPSSPYMFLIPPAPTHPQPLLRSSQDLIKRLHLLPAYDRFVRSELELDEKFTNHPPTSDRAKGKERERDDAVDADDDEKDGGKRKKTYRHLIKGVPGRHSMKKDEFLTNMIQVPEKQRIDITPFDLRTQRDAFSVSLEGLKGWNIHTLVAESTQAREDRKRRKELKKLAKAQTTTDASPTSSTAPPIPTSIVSTVASSTPQPARARSNTPRPATPAIPSRGVKRELDDGAVQPNTPGPGTNRTVGINGTVPTRHLNGNGAAASVGLKTGPRPRPVKKQRVDTQGQARDVQFTPMQQPTPQGV